jgi:hypothetical protein
MAIQTKDDAQSKADRRLDSNLNQPARPKKYIPLLERKFSDLVSLEDQLKWVELKKRQKDKNQTW